MHRKKIAIIGECMIELNGTPFGEMQQSFGGDTLNAAVYLKRMSGEQVDASYITAIGNDQLSKMMCECWQEEHINTEMVLSDTDHSTGLYMIHVDPHGERTFQYWRNHSAAKYLLQHPDFPLIAEQLLTVDVVFLSGITLAILSQQDRHALLIVLKKCKASGVKVAFDSNHRPALWSNNVTAKIAYREIYELCDIALVTFDDEQLVWQDAKPTDTLARLKRCGISKAVIKLGEQGCLSQDFNHDNNPTKTPAVKVDRVVDTTSAGDSFNGAFLALYIKGQDLSKCCAAGNLLASQVIQYPGAVTPRTVTNAIYNTIKESL
ncbi:sugar kinase [Photobacterium indicum]|uniref:sugar kinase n=1 Tax=Photobacterium indicum TaxID=81447 RepID=UPI003D14AC76